MNLLSERGRRWRVAAIVSLAVAMFGLVAYDVPSLIDGADASPDPYWIVLGSFATDVIALVAAYGAWRRQVWGVVLLIVVNAFWLLQSITTLFNPQIDADVPFALVMTALHALVFWCCLARPRQFTDAPAMVQERARP